MCSLIWFTGNTPQAQTHAQFPLAVGSLARGLILSWDSEDGPSSGGALTAPVLEARGRGQSWVEETASRVEDRCPRAEPERSAWWTGKLSPLTLTYACKNDAKRVPELIHRHIRAPCSPAQCKKKKRCWGVDYQPQPDVGLPKPSGSQLISAD